MFEFQPSADRTPVIVAACRTPIGKAFGDFADVDAQDLVVPLIERLLQTVPVPLEAISDVILGNAAGGGGNLARLAALTSSLPIGVPGVTIDRQCGSGLESIILASRLVQSGAGECYLAGGVESTSTAPWRAERPRKKGAMPRFFSRARFSPDKIGDPEMGVAAENVARECGITRERQDAFALQSHQRAIESMRSGLFDEEIVPIATANRRVERDECPRPTTSLDALASLQPVFEKNNGTVTAGNSCPLNDGASLVMVMSGKLARELRISSGMVFIDAASAGTDPNLLGLGPVESTKRLLIRQPNLSLSEASKVEFNEAFAAQVLGSLDQLGIAAETVNREGGAIALGHPFGASGAILVTRLYSQLKRAGENRALGMAMLGIAGGLGLTALFHWQDSV